MISDGAALFKTANIQHISGSDNVKRECHALSSTWNACLTGCEPGHCIETAKLSTQLYVHANSTSHWNVTKQASTSDDS